LNIDKTCYNVFGCTSYDNANYIIKVDDKILTSVKYTKYLGVLIDSELTWKDHIDHLYKNLLKFVGIFYRLRYTLNREVLKMIYFAFIHSQVLYGIEVYANTCKSNLNKLIVLNNKLLRVAQNCSIKTRLAALYNSYCILPVPLLHQYRLLLFVRKCLFSIHLLPNIFRQYFMHNSSIHQYTTRSSSNLHLYRVKSSLGLRNTRFKASQLWNELPLNLKETTSHSIFKRKLMHHLLQSLTC
jgi:hypothetical protein